MVTSPVTAKRTHLSSDNGVSIQSAAYPATPTWPGSGGSILAFSSCASSTRSPAGTGYASPVRSRWLGASSGQSTEVRKARATRPSSPSGSVMVPDVMRSRNVSPVKPKLPGSVSFFLSVTPLDHPATQEFAPGEVLKPVTFQTPVLDDSIAQPAGAWVLESHNTEWPDEAVRSRVSRRKANGDGAAMCNASLPLFVEVRLEPAIERAGCTPKQAMRVMVRATSTMRQVKEAIARKVGADPSLINLVSGVRQDGGTRFLAYEDTEPLGERRHLKLLGVDLPAVETDEAVERSSAADQAFDLGHCSNARVRAARSPNPRVVGGDDARHGSTVCVPAARSHTPRATAGDDTGFERVVQPGITGSILIDSAISSPRIHSPTRLPMPRRPVLPLQKRRVAEPAEMPSTDPVPLPARKRVASDSAETNFADPVGMPQPREVSSASMVNEAATTGKDPPQEVRAKDRGFILQILGYICPRCGQSGLPDLQAAAAHCRPAEPPVLESMTDTDLPASGLQEVVRVLNSPVASSPGCGAWPRLSSRHPSRSPSSCAATRCVRAGTDGDGIADSLNEAATPTGGTSPERPVRGASVLLHRVCVDGMHRFVLEAPGVDRADHSSVASPSGGSPKDLAGSSASPCHLAGESCTRGLLQRVPRTKAEPAQPASVSAASPLLPSAPAASPVPAEAPLPAGLRAQAGTPIAAAVPTAVSAAAASAPAAAPASAAVPTPAAVLSPAEGLASATASASTATPAPVLPAAPVPGGAQNLAPGTPLASVSAPATATATPGGSAPTAEFSLLGEPVAFDEQGRPVIVRQVDEDGQERTIVQNMDGTRKVFGANTVSSLLTSKEADARRWVSTLTDRQIRGLVHEFGHRLISTSRVYSASRMELEWKAKRADYAYFGLSETATEKDLAVAYRKMAKRMHPDKNGGTDEAKRLFQAMKERYEHLKERAFPQRRASDEAAEEPRGEPCEKEGDARDEEDGQDEGSTGGFQKGDEERHSEGEDQSSLRGEEADSTTEETGVEHEENNIPRGEKTPQRQEAYDEDEDDSPVRKGSRHRRNSKPSSEEDKRIEYDPHDRNSLDGTIWKMLGQMRRLKQSLDSIVSELGRSGGV